MSNSRIICFTHPHYTGHQSPTLTCKTCCGIFVTIMKAKIAAKEGQNPDQLNHNHQSNLPAALNHPKAESREGVVIPSPQERTDMAGTQNIAQTFYYNPESI